MVRTVVAGFIKRDQELPPVENRFNANLKVQLPPVNKHWTKLQESKVSDDQPTISASPDYSAAEKLMKHELKVFEMVVKGTSIAQSRFKAFLKHEMNLTLKNLIVKYKKQQLPERDLRKFKDLLITDGLRFVRENLRIELTANEIENPVERVIFTEEERNVLKNQAEKPRGLLMGKELDYQVVQQQFAHQQRQDFEKVTNLNSATLEILIENSNSRRTFFLRALVKDGYDQELTNVLNRSLAEEWMMFFEKVPRNDLCFEEMQNFAYKVADRTKAWHLHKQSSNSRLLEEAREGFNFEAMDVTVVKGFIER
ncbi:unnamed protein product, partial [Mesorhabditis belari]|uniref:Uncharacterized protein n=1 Tax=Mesorhabditis belari TaxID=2138241 RepID=A0AAF3EK06_9BILA